MRNFGSNENKVEYRRASYEIIQCVWKSEIFIAEGVSSLKSLVPESENGRLLRIKLRSSSNLL